MGEINVEVDAKPFLDEARARYADPTTSGLTVRGCPALGCAGKVTRAAITDAGMACECGRLASKWTGAPWASGLEVLPAPVRGTRGAADRIALADAPVATGGVLRVDPGDGRGGVEVAVARGESPDQTAQNVTTALAARGPAEAPTRSHRFTDFCECTGGLVWSGNPARHVGSTEGDPPCGKPARPTVARGIDGPPRPSESCMLCDRHAPPPRPICEACDAERGWYGAPLSRGAYDELARKAVAALGAARMGCAPAPWFEGSRGPVLACGNAAFLGDAVGALKDAGLDYEVLDKGRDLLRVLPAGASDRRGGRDPGPRDWRVPPPLSACCFSRSANDWRCDYVGDDEPPEWRGMRGRGETKPDAYADFCDRVRAKHPAWKAGQTPPGVPRCEHDERRSGSRGSVCLRCGEVTHAWPKVSVAKHASGSVFAGAIRGPDLAEALFCDVPTPTPDALAAFRPPPWPAWCEWERGDPYKAARIDAVDRAAGLDAPSRSLAEARERAGLELRRRAGEAASAGERAAAISAALAEAKAPGAGR